MINGKLRFAVSGFTSTVCPYLGGSPQLPCLFSSILTRRLISEIVLNSSISSQTSDFAVLGCKKPSVKSPTSRAWSSRTNVNLKSNLTARPWSRDLPKSLDLNVSMIWPQKKKHSVVFFSENQGSSTASIPWSNSGRINGLPLYY